MTASTADRRASRDLLVSGGVILFLTAMMVLIAVWYVKPRPAVPLPPGRCRVTMIPPGVARTAWAPIHFSLPSKISFSRTVQPGDPRLTTKLSPRPEDVRYLPRESKPDLLLPAPEKAALPAFTPWVGEGPVFAAVAPGTGSGAVTAEPLEGATVTLPPDFGTPGNWTSSGSWSLTVRLEAGKDGRVEHVFLGAPAPAPAVAARLEGWMRQARLTGGREARLRISRIEPPTGGNGEGSKP